MPVRTPLKSPAYRNPVYPLSRRPQRTPVPRQLNCCCLFLLLLPSLPLLQRVLPPDVQGGRVEERRFLGLWWGLLLQGGPPLRLLQQRSCSCHCCCCCALRQQQELLQLLHCTRRWLLEALRRGAAAKACRIKTKENVEDNAPAFSSVQSPGQQLWHSVARSPL